MAAWVWAEGEILETVVMANRDQAAALKRLKGIITLCGALFRNAKADLAEILEYALDLVANLAGRNAGV